jgi:uncharacterized protein (DUF1778 family)
MTSRPRRRKKKAAASRPLRVNLDGESRSYLTRAAGLRRISVGEYVRLVAVTQARQGVESACQESIALSPGEQLAFWNALNQPVQLTEAQKRLDALIRSDRI